MNQFWPLLAISLAASLIDGTGTAAHLSMLNLAKVDGSFALGTPFSSFSLPNLLRGSLEFNEGQLPAG